MTELFISKQGVKKMKIRKMPDVEPEERIYGFQVLFSHWIFEIYISLDHLKFYCNYNRHFKDLVLSLGFLNIGLVKIRPSIDEVVERLNGG